MSLTTRGIGLAKKIKHEIADSHKERAGAYLSPVRRIERIKTEKRVCAMTFDDGPCRIPASDGGRTEPLTLTLVNTLEKYGAKGTFDVIGDTSANYPDNAGKPGTASWGGVRYDHYPDIHKDTEAGAANCPELIERILAGGHEITSHTYSHVLFGAKPLVYGKRRYLGDIRPVLADLEKLHALMLEKYGYEIKLARPPHYVDKIDGRLTSYDAYAVMGYQYMAASFDGAGWLPLADYAAEVDAMASPVEAALAADPDALCGQIIFQKDGCNMARRTPVADGLEKQLGILEKYGYKVATVSELMSISQFADIPDTDSLSGIAGKLADKFAVAYSDNTLRPTQRLTRGELCMMLYGHGAAKERVERLSGKREPYFADMKAEHPYGAAAGAAEKAGAMGAEDGKFLPDRPVSSAEFSKALEARFGRKPESVPETITHGAAIRLIAEMC
jgi:peptidoglycan/xylan/chitin deacetylase (PgdA/CDA1 family)